MSFVMLWFISLVLFTFITHDLDRAISSILVERGHVSLYESDRSQHFWLKLSLCVVALLTYVCSFPMSELLRRKWRQQERLTHDDDSDEMFV